MTTDVLIDQLHNVQNVLRERFIIEQFTFGNSCPRGKVKEESNMSY